MTPKSTAAALAAFASVIASAWSASAAQLPEHGYVTTSVQIPSSAQEARSLGRDFDGDGDRDNALGQVLATMTGQGLDLNSSANAALAAGDVVMLHSLRAKSLADTKDATWQVWYGDPTPDPDLSGSGSFTLPLGGTHSAKLPAKIKDHKVTTAAGTVPLRLDLGLGVVPLPMVRAKVFATCHRSGCTDGRIAGAVTMEDVDAVLIPAMADLMSAVVARDCPGPGPDSCASESDGRTIENLFDTNQDLVITADELRGSDLIQAILQPDLDLAKGDGSPGTDGVLDAMSFGIGFTTVRAQLVRG